MKKVLLASTVALSVAGFVKTTVYAEESQATNNVQSSEKIATNTVSNEKKNQSEAEKATSQTPDTKEQPSKEAIVEVVNKEGWQKENSQWRYYENNQPVSNWKKIAGVWYYFNQDGIMLSNTIFNDYLLNNSGAMAESSWVKIADKWYYANEDGKVTRNNWKKIAGVWYRFDENGIMISNAVYDDYLFKSSGALAENSWVKIADKWYFGNEDGKITRNSWKKIAGVWYYFNQGGIMLSNTIFNDYLLNNSGALAENAWVKIDNQWYYATEDGKVTRNTWKKIAGVWYRFDESGTMLSNTIYNDYLLKSSGAMAENAWVKLEDKWYYATESGKIIRDKWEKIAEAWYRFDDRGIMLSQTIYNDYLIKTSGAMAENEWVKIADKQYYAEASGKITRNKWEKIKNSWYHFDTEGVMESSTWKDKYYLKDSGAMAENEWIFDKKYNSWFYLKSDGAYAENQWQGAYYLKSGGYMAKNEWIFDKNYDAWYYLKEDGVYVTGTFKIKGKDYSFQSNGKWISDLAAYYKVKPITANVYSASGEKLSYISQGSIVAIDGAEAKDGRLPVKISGLSGYMNKSDLVAVSSDSDFIPHYTTDGRYLYHELSPYASIRVAPHSSSMTIGKKYYSADGINFENFTVENPFLFRDLRKPSNYTAEELDKVYSLMNIKGSRLAGKGAIFKEAEERYHINALYLIAHSALESSWGRSQIAKDKNNFFGIAAYDTTPYDSAKSFDDVDKGILGAAKWIRENYIDNGRTYLGNKSSGMNVLYASDPYWGEKIASIMMSINSKLGEKD